jgi:hypothetical protein
VNMFAKEGVKTWDKRTTAVKLLRRRKRGK